jgi:hypothetical protein
VGGCTESIPGGHRYRVTWIGWKALGDDVTVAGGVWSNHEAAMRIAIRKNGKEVRRVHQPIGRTSLTGRDFGQTREFSLSGPRFGQRHHDVQLSSKVTRHVN